MKNMKVLAIMMALTMTAGLAAGCGGGQAGSQSAAESAGKAGAVAEEAAAEETPAPTEQAAEEPKATEVPQTAEKSEASQTADVSEKSGPITEEEAKEIALKDAGFKADEVVFKKAKSDMDDGILVYEVDFYAADKEYGYDIDPETGAILGKETDTMDAEDYAEMEAISGKQAGDQPDGSGITEEEALKIALEAAGVAEADTTRTYVQLDYDDDTGITTYDVEFHVGNTEYSYDIDTMTGEILSSEMDIDD